MGSKIEQRMQAPGGKKACSWIRAIRRFCKDRRGTAAVEMAIVAVPFLAITFAIMEQGIVFFTRFLLENSVAEASRQIRTGQVASRNMSASDFKNLICTGVSAISVLKSTCNSKLVVDVQEFNTFGDISGSLASAIDDDGNLDSPSLNGWEPGAPLSVMVVRVFYEWNTLTPSVFTKMATLKNGNLLITATNTFRNEPYQ